MANKCIKCKTQNAEWNCTECNADLCEDCAHFIDDSILCNPCYQEYLDDTHGICKFCGAEKEPIYDNVGWYKEGEESKWEIVGFRRCVYCTYTQDNIEEDNYDYIF